jgi:hypothetical protein
MPRQVGEHVVVITGASSGVGRETALRLGPLCQDDRRQVIFPKCWFEGVEEGEGL